VKVHVGASQLGVAKIGRHGEHVLVDLVIAIGTRFQGGDSPAVSEMPNSAFSSECRVPENAE
jgi:hypothetical protein